MTRIKFRQAALNEINSPDELEQLIRIPTANDWFILIGIGLLLIAALGWSLLGTVATYAAGSGILLAENGNIYNAPAPQGISYVVSIPVKIGQTVKQGSIVAYLDRPELIKKIDYAKKYLNELQINYAKLEATSRLEIEQNNNNFTAKNATLERSKDIENLNLQHLRESVDVKEKAFSKGYVTRDDLARSQSEYYTSKRQLEQITSELINNQNEHNRFLADWQQRLHDAQQKILDKQYEISNLQAELESSKVVVSPVAGTIVGINAAIGSMVDNNNSSLVSIANGGNGMDALIYVSSKDGQRIKKNMDAIVSLAGIKKEEFGGIIGQVVTVDTFPSTPQSIEALLQNQELVKQFTENGAPIAVRLNLKKDPSTVSGYAWSSSHGPNTQILPGSLVNAQIAVNQQPPITLLIPALKKLIGIT